MKTNNIRIQYYFLVPLIFSGMTALAVLLTYQLTRYSANMLSGNLYPLLLTGAFLVGTVFLCGLLILWLVFRPVETFLRQAQHFVPDTRPPAASTRSGYIRDDAPIAHTFNRVTEALGNMEARSMFPDIVAPSTAMRSVLALILKIAPTDSTVLILGESGSGKELVARNIHSHSHRAAGPFVAINCAGIPENLLESELFGHEKGAFTGAYTRKIGKLEAAKGGTVFLDEIADMPMITQAKILRALQEREVERVGGNQTIPVDVRFIAATNKDILKMVRDGTFREDLYFRIDVFSFHLPSLRERSEDIPLLATHLLRMIKPDASFSPRALAALTAHQWPGNVRELKNTIEAAVALAGNLIEPEHLMTSTRSQFDYIPDEIIGNNGVSLNIDERLAAIEKGIILDALMRTGGVQVRAAELLGIKERSLWHRISKHQIDVSSLRSDRYSEERSLHAVEH